MISGASHMLSAESDPARAADATAEQHEAKSRLLLFAMIVAPFAAGALLLRPQMALSWPKPYYLTIHTVVETLATVVAFATFAVQWYAAGAKLNDARARLIGSAFLAVALLETAHILAFPGMPGLMWLEASTERGIVYWLSARFWSVAALLVAIAVPPDSASRLLRRGPLLAFALGGVAAVLAADYLWVSRQPLFFIEGTGLTPLKKGLEFVVAGAAFVGMLVYRRRQRTRGERSAGDLSFALGLTVLSELCFMLYARAYDSFNLLGHLYLLLACYGVFHALFVEAVIRPYERLGATTRELAASNTELQRLRGHIEGELAVTIRNLEALQEQREDFVRAVSHDLRTPLQVVLLQSQRLARSAEPASRERRAGESVVAAGRQMAAMIQDLVDSVHLESGTVALAKQPIELATFVDDLLGVARGALDVDRVRVEISRGLPPVHADPGRLQRVVQNLLANALKYSPPDTPVSIAAAPAGRDVVVAVTDCGVGIPPEDRERVFQRFYRGSQHGKSEGLGLGLYISRLTVAAHGGRIWCDSTVGQGSTFAFSLPLDSAQEEPDSRSAPRAHA